MRIDVVSLFPQMFEALTGFGVSGRAHRNGLYQLRLWNPRDFTANPHRTVDDRPYGGGPGMVMMAAPLAAALRAARAERADRAPVIYLSPQGRRLSQQRVGQAAAASGMILLCGRYEGVDQRLIEAEVDEEWSIGDYVLSGGELAAMVVIDALLRLVPGVVGDGDSVRAESFMDGLLDFPQYTRPEVFEDRAVPGVLLSGSHEQIRKWRLAQALAHTRRNRPDLLAGSASGCGQGGGGLSDTARGGAAHDARGAAADSVK